MKYEKSDKNKNGQNFCVHFKTRWLTIDTDKSTARAVVFNTLKPN